MARCAWRRADHGIPKRRAPDKRSRPRLVELFPLGHLGLAVGGRRRGDQGLGRRPLKAEHRTALTLAAAIFLPLLLFAAVQVATVLRDQAREVESQARDRAQKLNAVIDGQLWSDLSALDVMSSSVLIEHQDWPQALNRLTRIEADRPRWKNVILTDLASGQELWETARPLGEPRPPRPSIRAWLASGRKTAAIFGIWPGPPPCPCFVLHRVVFENGRPTYLLSAEIGPQDVQSALMAAAGAQGDVVSGVVDAEGRFLARSRNPAGRVGRLASGFVQSAVRSGRGGGVYAGWTLEGVRNFTAFERSSLSGWSTHIALARAMLTAPREGSLALTVAAAVIAVVLAAGIGLSAAAQTRERLRAEARRRQSQKLEAVGQLASGVAHDFNNLLAVVIGNLERLAERVGEAEQGAVRNALEAAERGERLTRQLLGLARSRESVVGRVDLETLLASVRDLLVQSVGPKVRLTVEVGPDGRLARAAADELELALINLAVNARDAMPEGGDLAIRTRAVRRARDRWVEIAVADTGQGMSAEVAERATDPFFTTKATGAGTGLGMAQVLAAVTAAGGSLRIDSAPGKGTTVTLRLPAWG